MRGQRSSSYPSYTIEYALSFVEKIYKNYGTNYRAKREEIATALGLSVSNIVKKISTANQYGFLDMKSKEGYLVTDRFIKAHRPINEEDRTIALIEAVKSPPLYESLFESFNDNTLPPQKPLSNILLQKHNIAENVCEKAASVFEDNVVALNILDDNRFLSFRSINNDDEPEEYEEIEEENYDVEKSIIVSTKENEPKENKNNTIKSNNNLGNVDGVVIPILLKDRRTAHLGLPNDAKSSDLDTIINWIRLMKESFE